jgi:hypothetical protein
MHRSCVLFVCVGFVKHIPIDVIIFLNKLYSVWTILFWTKITWIMLLTVTASSVWSEQQGFYWVPLQVNCCFDQFWCDKLSSTIFSCNLRHYFISKGFSSNLRHYKVPNSHKQIIFFPFFYTDLILMFPTLKLHIWRQGKLLILSIQLRSATSIR